MQFYNVCSVFHFFIICICLSFLFHLFSSIPVFHVRLFSFNSNSVQVSSHKAPYCPCPPPPSPFTPGWAFSGEFAEKTLLLQVMFGNFGWGEHRHWAGRGMWREKHGIPKETAWSLYIAFLFQFYFPPHPCRNSRDDATLDIILKKFSQYCQITNLLHWRTDWTLRDHWYSSFFSLYFAKHWLACLSE